MRPLNPNVSRRVSVCESVLRGLLPHRNTASANRAVRVVSWAVSMTDYWQLNLPQKHRGGSPGTVDCECSLWRSAVSLATMGVPSPPPSRHPQLSWWGRWDQMTFFTMIYIKSSSSYHDNQCKRGLLYQPALRRLTRLSLTFNAALRHLFLICIAHHVTCTSHDSLYTHTHKGTNLSKWNWSIWWLGLCVSSSRSASRRNTAWGEGSSNHQGTLNLPFALSQ